MFFDFYFFEERFTTTVFCLRIFFNSNKALWWTGVNCFFLSIFPFNWLVLRACLVWYLLGMVCAWHRDRTWNPSQDCHSYSCHLRFLPTFTDSLNFFVTVLLDKICWGKAVVFFLARYAKVYEGRWQMQISTTEARGNNISFTDLQNRLMNAVAMSPFR